MQILDKKYDYNGEILTEVRAGQTGRGLLIENDGHILTNTDTIKQIREDISHGDKFIVPDDFIVSAVFQKYGIQNKNGRIYPEAVLKREVDNYIKEAIASHCAVGAVDHPVSLSLSGHDVSHNIIELHWEGATLVGKMKLHVSPGFKRYGICSTSGDLAANMIIDGIRIGVSSRGAGNVVEKNGIYYVDDSFSLVGWDIVLEPSTPGSYIDENPENLRQFIDMRPNVEDSNMDNKLDLISKILQSYKS